MPPLLFGKSGDHINKALHSRCCSIRSELPSVGSTDNIACNECRLICIVFTEIETAKFYSAIIINYSNKRIANHAKVLIPFECFVNIYCEYDATHIVGYTVEINKDLLIVTFASSGKVISHMLNGSIRPTKIIEEYRAFSELCRVIK